MTKVLTEAIFTSDVLPSEKLVVIDFWAQWCGPCRMLSSTIDELSTELEGKATIYKCNIDECPNIPNQYSIRSIPTLILFKNGQAIATKVGGSSKSDLKEWIESYL